MNDTASSSDRDERPKKWLIRVVGGACVLAALFVIDRLRPHKKDIPLGAQADGRLQEKPLGTTEHRATGAVAASDAYPAPPNGYHETASIWPVVVAAGITFTAFGVVTNVTFSIIGILIFISGVIGWAGELIGE